jgi:hypothetical protein
MSRSYRKNPAGGITTARTDKPFKRFANRSLRRRVRMGDFDLRLRDISDPWVWPKDGKTWYPKRDYVPDYKLMMK